MSGPQGFCIWVLQVVVLLGLLVFFLWLILRPLDPTYTIVELSIPGAGGANATDPLLGLEIANNNREGQVHYDDIAITLYLDERSVGAATIPSFYQAHGRTREWRGGVAAAGGGRPWSAILREAANRTAELRVGLVTAVRHRLWRWRSKPHRMDMQAALPVGADGRIAGKSGIKLHRARRRWKLRH